MPLQAVLFDFNGTIIDDEAIHHQLIDELLISENLRPTGKSYRQISLGKSDRVALLDILAEQGRSMDDLQLQKMLAQKSAAYQKRLSELTELPIYGDLIDFLDNLESAGLQLAIVTGATRADVEMVMARTNLSKRFEAIVAAEDVANGKPAPDGYLQAAQQLGLAPQDCLAIEDTFPGLLAAKAAQIPVIGIAHTYPFHMLQRRANWAVDCFADLEIQRIQETYMRVEDLSKSSKVN
jgi:beta-phosphoglucomutase